MQGAVSTPEIVGLTVNAKPVKSVQELQAALDAIEPGTKVKMAFKSKGRDLTLEGTALQAK
jgi:S1-C subfamily serine protease